MPWQRTMTEASSDARTRRARGVCGFACCSIFMFLGAAVDFSLKAGHFPVCKPETAGIVACWMQFPATSSAMLAGAVAASLVSVRVSGAEISCVAKQISWDGVSLLAMIAGMDIASQLLAPSRPTSALFTMWFGMAAAWLAFACFRALAQRHRHIGA
jgi:hypothetical protein